MNAENTGKLIQDKRIEKGMTQRNLAAALNVSNRTVSKWERGKGFPDISLLEPISELLDVSVSSLLAGEMEEQTGEMTVGEIAGAFRRQLKKITFRQAVDFVVKLILFLAIIGYFFFILEYNGAFNKDISMEVPVGIYKDGKLVEESKVIIDGELYRSKVGPQFGGRFAIDYVERTCRDRVSSNITWNKEYGDQTIAFYGSGEIYLSSEFGLRSNIYISPDMRSFALKMTDGTVIATDEYYVPLMGLDYYYSISYKSVGNYY